MLKNIYNRQIEYYLHWAYVVGMLPVDLKCKSTYSCKTSDSHVSEYISKATSVLAPAGMVVLKMDSSSTGPPSLWNIDLLPTRIVVVSSIATSTLFTLMNLYLTEMGIDEHCCLSIAMKNGSSSVLTQEVSTPSKVSQNTLT